MPTEKLHIESAPNGVLDPINGGLYVYNPNNTTNSFSSICSIIAVTTVNKDIYSMDVNRAYGGLCS